MIKNIAHCILIILFSLSILGCFPYCQDPRFSDGGYRGIYLPPAPVARVAVTQRPSQHNKKLSLGNGPQVVRGIRIWNRSIYDLELRHAKEKNRMVVLCGCVSAESMDLPVGIHKFYVRWVDCGRTKARVIERLVNPHTQYIVLNNVLEYF